MHLARLFVSRAKSLPRSELPLLGSNQDSPDPESGVLPVTPRGTDLYRQPDPSADRSRKLLPTRTSINPQHDASPSLTPSAAITCSPHSNPLAVATKTRCPWAGT